MADKAIDRFRAAFSARKRRVVVCGVEAFFSPLTTQDLDDVKVREPRSDEERNLYLLIMKAHDGEGKPLFDWADVGTLRSQVAVADLRELLEALYGVSVSVEEAEKELGKTPASTSGSASPVS